MNDASNWGMGSMSASMIVLMIVLMIWSIVWKGLAMWRAARRYDTAWFIVFMFLNTAGILEIIYYYLIARADHKS